MNSNSKVNETNRREYNIANNLKWRKYIFFSGLAYRAVPEDSFEVNRLEPNL